MSGDAVSTKRGGEGKAGNQGKRRKLAQLRGRNSPVYAQLLGVGSPDSTPSAMFVLEHTRALFNCGAGTQRFCNEHKLRLSKIDHIFLSDLSPENTGGVPGMLLSLEDTGKAQINLYGPRGLQHLLASTRFFMRTSNVIVHEFDLHSSNPKYPIKLGEGVRVWPLILRAHNKGDKYSISYICETPFVRGKFDPKASDDLGVPPHRRSELVRGTPITLENGNVVSPSQVLSAGVRGPMLAMIFCHDEDLVESLLENGTFKTFLESATCAEQTNLRLDSENSISGKGVAVIHFCSLSVLKCDSYQKLLKMGDNKTNIDSPLCHVLVNFQMALDISPFRAAHKLQKILNRVDEKVFPICENIQVDRNPDYSHMLELDPHVSKFVSFGKPLLKYILFPLKRRGVDEFFSHKLICTDDENKFAEASVTSRELKATSNDKYPVNTVKGEQHSAMENCKSELIILGTGSAIPSKYRNVSGIMLFNMDGAPSADQSNDEGLDLHGHVLLDCGEGTYGQLWNICKSFSRVQKLQGHQDKSLEALNETIQNIELVWISHKHADHLLGLPQLLSARYKLVRLPLYVVGPKIVELWLGEYSKAMESEDPSVHLHYKFVNADLLDPSFNSVSTSESEKGHLMEVESFLEKMHLSLGLCRIRTTEVVHCKKSFAIMLEHASGWSLVYSGDTRPCENVVKLGEGATILIHEATFEDGMEVAAIQKKHSTTSEAISIGNEMAADHIVLTHFSQRYPKLPSIKDIKCLPRVSIAHDLMRVPFAKIHTVPALYSSLQALLDREEFTNEEEE